jgi:hypothetical protein
MILKAHEADKLVDKLLALRLGRSSTAQPEADVLGYGLPGKQGELLEHNRAIGPWSLDRIIGDKNAP